MHSGGAGEGRGGGVSWSVGLHACMTATVRMEGRHGLITIRAECLNGVGEAGREETTHRGEGGSQCIQHTVNTTPPVPNISILTRWGPHGYRGS